jgi:hypothetical protein
MGAQVTIKKEKSVRYKDRAMRLNVNRALEGNPESLFIEKAMPVKTRNPWSTFPSLCMGAQVTIKKAHGGIKLWQRSKEDKSAAY